MLPDDFLELLDVVDLWVSDLEFTFVLEAVEEAAGVRALIEDVAVFCGEVVAEDTDALSLEAIPVVGGDSLSAALSLFPLMFNLVLSVC